MNIPEPPAPPREPTSEVLERALRAACRDQFVLFAEYGTDRHRASAAAPPRQPDPARVASVARRYLELAQRELDHEGARWTLTPAGRQYLRDYPLSPEELL